MHLILKWKKRYRNENPNSMQANGSDTKQGMKDAVELGHDFDVAIEAMTMLVVNIQKGEKS